LRLALKESRLDYGQSITARNVLVYDEGQRRALARHRQYGRVLGKADELRAGSEILIEIVALIGARARTCIKSRKSVEPALNAAIVGEIGKASPEPPPEKMRAKARMLVGMYVGGRANRITSVNLGKVREGLRRA
jgi:hypothetical protein